MFIHIFIKNKDILFKVVIHCLLQFELINFFLLICVIFIFSFLLELRFLVNMPYFELIP